jgi:hypothetical protein
MVVKNGTLVVTHWYFVDLETYLHVPLRVKNISSSHGPTVTK